MPPFDWSAILSTAPNIVTAVAFGFFVLKLLERQDKRDTKRDDQDLKRDGEWRSFLAQGRDHYITSIATVAVEMKSLADVVKATHDRVSAHDTWERAEIEIARAERTADIAATAKAVETAAKVAAAAVAAVEKN